jgi:DNA-binding CsgD family transcriptional regulator
VDISPAPELVEAYLRVGRPADASRLAAECAAAAEAKGRPWALARAARVQALVAGDDETAFAHFRAALKLHAESADAFERARTHLNFGERLRRTGRRADARIELRAASSLFDALRAQSWAARAQAELKATGETVRRRDSSSLDELTPQELRIALMLAEGTTTRQAAAALYLSPKTVEYHLRNVYLKLGVNSREALASALGRATPAPPARG